MTADEFRVERTGAAERPLRAVVHGDLDYAHHHELDDVLTELVALLHPGEQLVVDVADVPYCDSCGLRTLLGAAQRVEALGGTFALRGATGQPARTLRLTGLDTVLGGAGDVAAEGPAVQA